MNLKLARVVVLLVGILLLAAANLLLFFDTNRLLRLTLLGVAIPTLIVSLVLHLRTERSPEPQ
jgi:hypothetical protein